MMDFHEAQEMYRDMLELRALDGDLDAKYELVKKFGYEWQEGGEEVAKRNA